MCRMKKTSLEWMLLEIELELQEAVEVYMIWRKEICPMMFWIPDYQNALVPLYFSYLIHYCPLPCFHCPQILPIQE